MENSIPDFDFDEDDNVEGDNWGTQSLGKRNQQNLGSPMMMQEEASSQKRRRVFDIQEDPSS